MSIHLLGIFLFVIVLLERGKVRKLKFLRVMEWAINGERLTADGATSALKIKQVLQRRYHRSAVHRLPKKWKQLLL